jgi:hypothetical protein
VPSSDHLIRILAGLAVLLFVGRGLLARGRGRYRLRRWARWGAVAVYAAAVCYALIISLFWAFGASR